MLRKNARTDLNNYITEKCGTFTGNRKKIFSELKKTYGIPIDLSSDIFTLRKDIREFSDFIAFAILSVLDNKLPEKYFKKEEIEKYSDSTYKVESLELPIKFDDMIQVNDDQWIGKISCKKLMQMKDARIINYNENAQRTMERVVNGEKEYWKISINKRSIKEIRESMEKGIYISDDITINMPPDKTDFSFRNNTITINKMETLDLLDGYHRYLAISQIYNIDSDFDYNMEFRIVCYPIEKAQQFIYQKDQKTQMKKSSSRSFNQYSLANRVVNMVNQDPMCLMQGLITRNKGIIDSADFATVIDAIFFKGKSFDNENLAMINTKNFIVQRINTMVEQNNIFLSKRMDSKTLIVAVYVMAQKDEKEVAKAISYIMSKIVNEKSSLFNLNTRVSKAAIRIIDKHYAEWKGLNNV